MAPSRLNPPYSVRDIATRLEDAGFETWCVGGAVRDALLGRTHLDWDLATRATPAEVRGLFRRTVPVGIEFGTVAVLDRANVMHEVTTFRRDVRTDGRHAVVEFGASLDEDLARRDFTINAIAFSPRLGRLHDPFGGRLDLERKVVRAVGDPSERMREDWLRALRALRFAARFAFDIESKTWEAIVHSAPHLPRLSRERVRQEMEKTMDQVKRPSVALELWRRSGALASLIPALAAQAPVAFQAADAIGVPEETSRAELSSGRRAHRLTTLFLGVDPDVARRILRDLRFSNRQVSWMGDLVETWRALEPDMRQSLAGGEPMSDASLRRWAARSGRAMFRDLIRVTAARWSAEREAGGGATVPRASRAAGLLRRGLRVAYGDPVSVQDLAIDGSDLLEAGVPAGPAIGEWLRRLLSLVLADPALNRRDTLLEVVRGGAPEAGASPETR